MSEPRAFIKPCAAPVTTRPPQRRAAVISNEMRLPEATGRLGLVVVTKPSYAIPGVRLSHTNLEPNDNDCGMSPDIA